MSHNDTTPLYQSDIDEIENMINNDGSVLPARPSITVTSSPFFQSNLPTPPPPSSSSTQKVTPVPELNPFRTLMDAYECIIKILALLSWAAYPFMSAAVNPKRKALALYPLFLMYVSVGFLIIAID
ncbi:hypothetical protein F2Q68_00037630 [Brassica cretica]|uniref:Uncharacterized protein n=1 Tax=Brassica cretica TaxID=69181 RepID=A0A8S9GYF8_BRACR|nr:hypothetical protein F2Q68_00037630 [Brassica cretica]